jgi:alpha-tubulin suppressor-like RCC1 family protein
VLSNVVAIAAGNEYSLALRKDGTVVSWGHPFSMQMVVPSGLSNVVAIAAGENFCLAITTNFPALPSK